MTRFQEKILELVSRIPKGRVATYKELAKAAGNPHAYRSVGNVLANNPRPIEIPCHRVVRSNSQVGGHVFDHEEKEKLLGEEGVKVEDGRVDLEKYLVKDLDSIK